MFFLGKVTHRIISFDNVKLVNNTMEMVNILVFIHMIFELKYGNFRFLLLILVLPKFQLISWIKKR